MGEGGERNKSNNRPVYQREGSMGLQRKSRKCVLSLSFWLASLVSLSTLPSFFMRNLMAEDE
jgi:hypothetical protein